MNKMKMISAAVLLSATVASPVFAQDGDTYGPSATPYAARHPQTFYRSYSQVNPDFLPPRNNDEYRNLQNFGFTGRNPSRVGGESPSLNPPS
jgi:hypothetical protein